MNRLLKRLWCYVTSHSLRIKGYVGSRALLFRMEECARCGHREAVAASLGEVLMFGPMLVEQEMRPQSLTRVPTKELPS